MRWVWPWLIRAPQRFHNGRTRCAHRRNHGTQDADGGGDGHASKSHRGHDERNLPDESAEGAFADTDHEEARNQITDDSAGDLDGASLTENQSENGAGGEAERLEDAD